MDLADIALAACEDWLVVGGDLAIKAFQGEGLDAWVSALRQRFEQVNMMKPKASRPESREVFVVARGFMASQNGQSGGDRKEAREE
jgi:23S rRNA (uridine2552-2'-O)-methyltransferase